MTVSVAELAPAQARARIRDGELTGPTAGFCLGYQQANLVALPAALADDFEAFCRANPDPCPLLARTEPGDPQVPGLARDADLRTDLPRYRVLESGLEVTTPAEVLEAWRQDTVAFLLGCSLGFESALLEAGVPLRHVQHGRWLPMYETTVACEPVGAFAGPLVVSLRPLPRHLAQVAADITTPSWWSHGGPVHIGDPAELGIPDLAHPSFGDPPVFEPGDVPVFWACGVTPQLVARAAAPPYLIAHYPGHMLITDLPADQDPGA